MVFSNKKWHSYLDSHSIKSNAVEQNLISIEEFKIEYKNVEDDYFGRTNIYNIIILNDPLITFNIYRLNYKIPKPSRQSYFIFESANQISKINKVLIEANKKKFSAYLCAYLCDLTFDEVVDITDHLYLKFNNLGSYF